MPFYANGQRRLEVLVNEEITTRETIDPKKAVVASLAAVGKPPPVLLATGLSGHVEVDTLYPDLLDEGAEFFVEDFVIGHAVASRILRWSSQHTPVPRNAMTLMTVPQTSQTSLLTGSSRG